MITTITLKDVENISFELAKKLLEWDEPIPDFNTRYPGVLESCLGNALVSFGGKQLYPTLEDKAAIIFYQINKNHPFQNGNKRIALTTLLVFLYLNNRWINVTNMDAYEFAVWIVSSPPRRQKETFAAIKEFIVLNSRARHKAKQ